MSFGTIIRCDSFLTRRLVLCVMCLVAFGAWSAIPATAGLIAVVELDSVERLTCSLDAHFMSAEHLFGFGSQQTTVGTPLIGSVLADSAFPARASDPWRLVMPFAGLGMPIRCGRPGTDTGSRTAEVESSAGNAILCWPSQLPSPAAIGWLDATELFDISPVPSLELLRPPQIVAILA